MRKVFVNGRFLTQHITGVQRFAVEISKVLNQKYPERFHFLAPEKLLHKDVIKSANLSSFGRTNGLFWEQVELPQYLNHLGPDKPLLLNLGNSAPLLYGNKVTSLHDVAFLENPSWYSRGFMLWYKFMIPRSLRSSRHVLTVSDFSKREIMKHYEINPAKITVIHNAVADFFLQENDKEIKNLPESFLLAVSSEGPRKNLINVLKAYRKVQELKPQLKLIVAGGASSKPFRDHQLKSLLAEMSITLTRPVDDATLRNYYAKAACLVYPTLYEGFGIPPMEAAAQNCPSVVSANSAMREIYSDAAMFCEPHDVESIVSSVLELLDNKDLRNRLTFKAKVNLKKYSWEKSADRIYHLAQTIDA